MTNSEKRPLWAPWRIDFIRSEKEESCFLCGKKEKTNSNDEKIIIRREKNVFVILNRFPYNSGHLMIATYRHVGDLSSLTPEERHELMDVSVTAKDILTKLMAPDGFNIGFNLGKAAGAGVEEHIHLHIVPRWIGDTNFMPVISDTRVVPESLEDTAELIRNTWT